MARGLGRGWKNSGYGCGGRALIRVTGRRRRRVESKYVVSYDGASNYDAIAMVEGGGGVRRSVETGSGIVLGLGTTTYVCMYWGSCWGLELGQASMKSRRIPRPLLGVCTLLKVDGLLLENTINPVKLPPTTYPTVPKLSSAPHQCRRRPAWPLCCSRPDQH